MDSKLCRAVNLMSLELVAKYFEAPLDEVMGYYQELLDDTKFLDEINEQITHVRQYYKKGLFRNESVDSVDWFGMQRILMYVVTRLKKPTAIVETGVFYGGNTLFFLNALRKNGHGTLYSIDLPAAVIAPEKRHELVGDSEYIPAPLDVGFIVHNNLRPAWKLIRGDSAEELPKLAGKIDIFMHDSEHTYDFIRKEVELVWDKLTPSAVIMADDLDWSNGFISVCCDRKLHPMIITDNGKSGLLARTGVARLDHPNRKLKNFVG